MKKIAIIVAGGSGTRMGTEMPKQFLLLQGKPVLWHTLRAFLQAYDDLQIVLVLPQAHMQQGQDIVDLLNAASRVQLVTGGETRFHSVKNGLALVGENAVVFVHDGVRCMISAQLIRNCYEQALTKGSAIPAVTATDSIRITTGDEHTAANRDNIRIIQTPQTFLSNILLPAFEQEYTPAFTDEATVVEYNKQKVYLIDGEYDNIKITRPVDLIIAEKILEGRK
jgi:2-C-methyl-D-erythritol 4-phosphate cytidylyltransferase